MKNLLRQTHRTSSGNVLSVLFIMAFVLGSLQGWGQIALRGTAQTNTSTSTSVTVTKPAGLAVGDVMIATINQADNDDDELGNAALFGWQLLGGAKYYPSGNFEWWGTVLYKVATASDVTANNFTFTGDSEADDMQASIIAFSGVDQINPIDVTGTFTSPTDNNTSLSASSITTTTNNAAVIMLAMVSDNIDLSSWIATSPTSLTELFDVPFNADLDMGIGGAWAIKPSAGATGSGTATLSGNARKGGILIALREVAQATINNYSYFRSNSSGNWSSIGTWQMSPNGTSGWVPATFFPTTNSNVTISDNHTVTLDVDATISTLSIAAGNNDTNLNFNNSGGNKTLTVSGSARIFAGTGTDSGGDDKRINIGSGWLKCASLRIYETNSDAIDSEVLISTGTLDITGNIQMDGTAARNAIIFSNAGTLNVGGSFNSNTLGSLVTVAGSTVNYDGADQTARAQIYLGNVTLSGSGVKTFATSPTVNQVLSLEGTATISIAPNYVSTSTLKYNTDTPRNAGVEWVTPFTSNGGIVFTNTGAITNASERTVSSEISGNGTLVNTGTLKIEGVCSVSYLVADNAVNTVNYASGAGGVDQAIKVTNYHNLELTGTSKTLAGGITVNGDLSISSSATTALTLSNTPTIILKGSFTHTSGNIAGAGTLNFQGDYVTPQIYTHGGGTYPAPAALTFIVDNGGYFQMAVGTIPPAGLLNFNINTGGTYCTILSTGLTYSNEQSNPVFGSGSKVVYKSTSTQYLGGDFPNGVNVDVTVENTSSTGLIWAKDALDLVSSDLITIDDLKVIDLAKLTLPTGKSLKVQSLFTNEGTIRIESDGVTFGHLLQVSSNPASGNGTCVYARKLPKIANNAVVNQQTLAIANRSYYFGSPVAADYASGTYTPITFADGLSNANNTTLKVWGYDETSNQFPVIINNGGTPSSPNLGIGKGFYLNSSPAYYSGASEDLYYGQADFTGKYFMNGDITVNVTKTGSNGFNLLSNPYPSAINWTSVYGNASNTSLVPTYWLRTFQPGAGMVFQTCNGASTVSIPEGIVTIAPGTAFWVKYDGVSPTGTVTFKNSMRTNAASTNYTLNANHIIRLNLGNGAYDDQAVVYMNENAGLGIESYDSDKRIPNASVHQFYSLEGSTKLAINGFSDALAKDSVLFGMQIPTAGTFTINASQIDATIGEEIFLEDKITGAYQNLKVNPIYSFTSAAGTFNNRFVLHFAPAAPVLPGQSAATAIALPTSNWPQCNNMTSEDTWHSFTATSEGVSIAVNTSSTDVVVALHDEFGNVISEENAVNGIGNETLNFFGLTAGQTYKVAVRNSVSTLPIGTYGVCVKSLKRGGCDFGAGPYSLCQYYKATWAGSSSVNYKFTFTATSGPAAGQTFTRTQNSNICVLSTITPALPYGSTYDVVISNIYNLTDGAGNTEQLEVPSASGCQVVTLAEPQTTLSASNTCNNGERFRTAVVTSMPWVCGANNWRWKFTEVNPVTMQTIGSPIEVNRGSATNHINLGSVSQLQNGKMYAVETAPIFSYTGTNYNYGPVQYMCIVKTPITANVTAEAGAAESNTKTLVEDKTNAMVFVSEGNLVNIQLTNATSNTANRADIYDVTGKCVKSVRLVEGMNQVTLTESEGIYMVRTTVGNQSETARVFIKN